jgi:hypothetical protein
MVGRKGVVRASGRHQFCAVIEKRDDRSCLVACECVCVFVSETFARPQVLVGGRRRARSGGGSGGGGRALRLALLQAGNRRTSDIPRHINTRIHLLLHHLCACCANPSLCFAPSEQAVSGRSSALTLTKRAPRARAATNRQLSTAAAVVLPLHCCTARGLLRPRHLGAGARTGCAVSPPRDGVALRAQRGAACGAPTPPL